ncbi:MAG: thioredoxin family protein [Kofleriaceae bacterium]
MSHAPRRRSFASLAFAASLSALLSSACSAAATRPPPPKVAAINAAPGAMVDIEAELARGYVTIVDFWAEYCAACKTVEAELMAAIADEPSIVVRKVDVGPGDSEVARAYGLGGLPHLRIFDRRGRLRYQLVGQDARQAGEAARQLSREE